MTRDDRNGKSRGNRREDPRKVGPHGPPEEKYGATFGQLTEVPRREPPPRPRAIRPLANAKIKEIQDHFQKEYEGEGIILMTASAIDLEENSEFPGLHVGSYYNKLFKRAMISSDVPKVIFLDEDKITPFEKGKCFPVCDPDLPWSQVCQQSPIAIAIAFRDSETAAQVKDTLGAQGLQEVEQKAVAFDGLMSEEQSVHVAIMSNEKFVRRWEEAPFHDSPSGDD